VYCALCRYCRRAGLHISFTRDRLALERQAQQLYALRRKVFIGEMLEYTTGSRNDQEVRVGYCNHCR
jgi:hypothetical protein